MIDPAAAATDEPLGPGQYRYIATRAWWMASFGMTARRYAYLAENLVQVWVPADQTQDWLLERRLTGRRTWLQGSREQALADGFEAEDRWPTGRWRAPHGDFFAAGAGQQPGPQQGCWQVPTADFLAALPRDARQLYDRLRADSPADRPGYTGVLTYAIDALQTGLVPADLRAALYRALLLLPTATMAETADDKASRHHVPGVSLVLDDGTLRTEILIDPANGQFAGLRRTLTRDVGGLKAGTLTESSDVTTAVVDTIGELPTPVCKKLGEPQSETPGRREHGGVDG